MARKKEPRPEPQPFVIRSSGIQGRGAFAVRAIRKGTRVIEYVGERITWAEVDRRYDDEDGKKHHTLLFEVTPRTVIDAGAGGNDSRFINHSCTPNCESVDVGGRIWIEAVRDIRRGEELTYEYGYTPSGPDDLPSRYPCRCGAPSCRGTILKPARKKRARARRGGRSRKKR